MLSHRNLMTMVSGFLAEVNPAAVDDVLLHAAPITHGSGLSIFHHIARGAASAFPLVKSFEPPRHFRRYREVPGDDLVPGADHDQHISSQPGQIELRPLEPSYNHLRWLSHVLRAPDRSYALLRKHLRPDIRFGASPP